MKFILYGDLRIGDKRQHFKKEVDAENEDAARERTYSLFGSEHGTKRRWINIEKIEKKKEE